MNVLVVTWSVAETMALAGGTLARLGDAGCAVTVLSITAPDPSSGTVPGGDVGVQDPAGGAERTWKELGQFKFEELRCESLIDVRPLRDDVTDAIRGSAAEMVLTPSATSLVSEDRSVAHLVFNAAYGACVPNYPSPRGLPAVPNRAPIWHTDALDGRCAAGLTYVDISGVWDRKRAALSAWHEVIGWSPVTTKLLDRSEVVSRARGIQVQVEHAEAFQIEEVWGRLTTRRLLP